MRQKKRARCPLCGLLSDVDHFQVDRDYKINVVIQSFGGKVSHEEFGSTSEDTKGKGRGSNPGRIEYEDITDTKEGREIAKMIKNRRQDG